MLSLIFPRVRYGLGFFLLLFCITIWAVVGVPELSQRVTDLTSTLNVEQIAALENKLAAFEAKKGSQIAVLIVPTTGPKDIAEFGIEVADLWELGRKGVDDGLILIVAKDDRKLRMEVGYGLEGVIPDAVAKRVIAETITPYFKKGDYAGGIDSGIMQLMKLIEGEALPTPTESLTEGLDEGTFLFILMGGLIVGFMLSVVVGRVMAGTLAGLGSGIVAVLVLGLAFSVALFVGIMIFFIVSVRSTGGRGLSNGGGFGGSGGGSWSGGGGGFGGGGASGSW
ncbi:MAG: TPM domain-containing protein [Methylobacter sp.]|nr:TPM domain-containing protein [Methylobacter sp.]